MSVRCKEMTERLKIIEDQEKTREPQNEDMCSGLHPIADITGSQHHEIPRSVLTALARVILLSEPHAQLPYGIGGK
jgi:hypothetical protein